MITIEEIVRHEVDRQKTLLNPWMGHLDDEFQTNGSWVGQKTNTRGVSN